MKTLRLLLFLMALGGNLGFSQEKPKERQSLHERIRQLMESCSRKEYANCYQLTLLYLEGSNGAKRILSQYADDKDFSILFIQSEDDLEKVKNAIRITREDKERSLIIQQITGEGLDFFGKRLLYVSCLNREEYSCAKIQEYCGVKEDKRSCNYKEKICQENKLSCTLIKKSESKDKAAIILWGAIILAGLASFLIARNIFLDEQHYQTSETLKEGVVKKEDLARAGVILKYSWPFFKRYLSPVIHGMRNKTKIEKKYKRPLASSGLSKILNPEDFFAFKLFLILGFPILFVASRELMETDWPLEYLPFVALIGFFYPNIWIKSKIQARQKEIIMEMPFCVDMLALSVEAGLDFVAAMVKVIEKSKKGPMAEEFETIVKEIRIGSSRAEALRNMSWRVNLPQISSFTATLIAADSVGASIGPILKSLGGEIREKRSADIEKTGATAATKILFPTIFFIVPAVLLVIAAPMILELVN